MMRALVNPILDFASHLYDEHPKIVLFVTLMCAMTLYSGTYFYANASTVESQIDTMDGKFSSKIEQLEDKVDSLKADFSDFQDQQARNFLLLEIRSMEREIYQLEQVIDSGDSTQRDRDRLVEVRSQYAESLRQLNALPVRN